MAASPHQAWLEAGYARFATHGPAGLQVEALARLVGKSKSSFYHYFADVEQFTLALLAYHRQRAAELAAAERQCQQIDPELIEVMTAAAPDLFFQRQLRLHRHLPHFAAGCAAADHLLPPEVLALWAHEMGLSGRVLLAESLLGAVQDHFYLHLNPATFDQHWLRTYLNQVRQLVLALQQD